MIDFSFITDPSFIFQVILTSIYGMLMFWYGRRMGREEKKNETF